MGRVSSELGQRVYLDSNIVIYTVEGFADYADQIHALLEAMDTGEVVAVTSELTLAETLVRSKPGNSTGLPDISYADHRSGSHSN